MFSDLRTHVGGVGECVNALSFINSKMITDDRRIFLLGLEYNYLLQQLDAILCSAKSKSKGTLWTSDIEDDYHRNVEPFQCRLVELCEEVSETPASSISGVQLKSKILIWLCNEDDMEKVEELASSLLRDITSLNT